MTTFTRICPTCDEEFIVYPKHPNVKFCSPECYAKSQQKRIIKACQGCGKEFKESYVGQKFCSRECGFKHRKRRERTKTKQCICVWCGKQFETFYCRKDRKFCSHQCMSEYGASVTPGAPRKEGFRIIQNCKICGKPYETNRIQILLRGSSCCSKECVAELNSRRMRKDGNPNYRGGTILYRGANWGRQSRKALKRDGYRCQICGKRVNRHKHDYGIHHIRPFREYEGDYENANHLSNLITLCRSCHARVEFGGLPCPLPLPLPE